MAIKIMIHAGEKWDRKPCKPSNKMSDLFNKRGREFKRWLIL
ncbi:hypothetical protein [Thermoanaerobacter pentosaceus]|uniref:Uncharacterized protein n=1 Tax=Thermoanaerobacter pentosaceus TaxID=694059 RepID=A0ABT9M0W3_9THEO|nr:hypothetical protein [Thermoanaerobacter pentosaceus]MDP9749756.1 hypothetical protein [Thermoanaerobacter pentosaceus]